MTEIELIDSLRTLVLKKSKARGDKWHTAYLLLGRARTELLFGKDDE